MWRAEEVVGVRERAPARHVQSEQIRPVLDDDPSPADLRLAVPDLPADDRLAGAPTHNPSRSSVVASRRHFGRTLTRSSRKTGWPSSASISGRARTPMSFTIAPPLP